MVNKYLKFNIVDQTNAASLLTEGVQLVKSDEIQSVVYDAAAGVVSITLDGAVSLSAAPVGAELFAQQTYGARVIQLVVSTVRTGAQAIPSILNGASAPDKAIFAAMTANPGGVQSTVQLGVDQAATPLQMWFKSFTITTASIA
jgi:hypothetical protein